MLMMHHESMFPTHCRECCRYCDRELWWSPLDVDGARDAVLQHLRAVHPDLLCDVSASEIDPDACVTVKPPA